MHYMDLVGDAHRTTTSGRDEMTQKNQISVEDVVSCPAMRKRRMTSSLFFAANALCHHHTWTMSVANPWMSAMVVGGFGCRSIFIGKKLHASWALKGFVRQGRGILHRNHKENGQDEVDGERGRWPKMPSNKIKIVVIYFSYWDRETVGRVHLLIIVKIN
jgi:hypothetical protein